MKYNVEYCAEGVGRRGNHFQYGLFCTLFLKVPVHIFCWPDNRWMNCQSEPMVHFLLWLEILMEKF